MGELNSPNKKVKGKILRVKQGYNPNSSSMGSMVFALPAALLAVTVGFGAVSSIILAAFMKNTDTSVQSDETENSKSKK
jgi:hypothetical protein